MRKFYFCLNAEFKKQTGLSITEVLVSLILLSIMALTVGKMIIHSRRVEHKAVLLFEKVLNNPKAWDPF